jgi:Ca2+:H+ antiporter
VDDLDRTGLDTRERVAFAAVAAVSVLAVILHLTEAAGTLVFAVAGLAVAGLAWLLGLATEEAGEAAGPRVSALLNATFGNAAEIIIVVLAVREGLVDIAKASIVGSVIGNLLLILGGSLVISGLRGGRRGFDEGVAGVNASMVVFAAVALGVPTLFAALHGTGAQEEHLISDWVAVVMVLTYGAYLLASFQEPRETGSVSTDVARWPMRTSLVVLSITALATGALSEILVQAIEPTIEETGINPIFIGLIVVPIIGNVAEHAAAFRIAWKGDIDFAVGISFNSALQVALAVSAIAVAAGAIFDHPVTLAFSALEITLLVAASLMTGLIASTGSASWVEGFQLLMIYAIAALAFWFV